MYTFCLPEVLLMVNVNVEGVRRLWFVLNMLTSSFGNNLPSEPETVLLKLKRSLGIRRPKIGNMIQSAA